LKRNSSFPADEDYTGGLTCCYFNVGTTNIQLVAGESYAQLLVIPYWTGPAMGNQEIDFDAFSPRGSGSFGSTDARRRQLQQGQQQQQQFFDQTVMVEGVVGFDVLGVATSSINRANE
jgi:hypothetical protein